MKIRVAEKQRQLALEGGGTTLPRWQRGCTEFRPRGVGLVMVSGGFEGLMDLWGKVGAVPRFSEREER